jgi:predicted nucleic acid-binding protein
LIAVSRHSLASGSSQPLRVSEAEASDAADQQVLATLRASHADYLITGDKDLLALAGKYPIVTPAVFWERHG